MTSLYFYSFCLAINVSLLIYLLNMPKISKCNEQKSRNKLRLKTFRQVKSIMKQDEENLFNVIDLRKKILGAKPNMSENETESPSLPKKLRSWAIEYHIKQRALSALLKILFSFGMTMLPRDSRALLKTPRFVEIEKRANGDYWYNGLSKCLKTIFAKLGTNLHIELNFNIDGLPLFKSSPITFWPILANVHGFPNIKPMVIAIWSGIGKPDSVNDFLEPFVKDINETIKNGISINGYRLEISVRSFICDSPARSMLKGTVYFNHKYGCQRCFAVGAYSTAVRRTYFADFSQAKRTDMSFRDKSQPIHHKERSILEDLQNIDGKPLLDMINHFPTSDPLHLLEEGVMKRLFLIWRKGTTIFKKKWSNLVQLSISKLILLLNKQLPGEINRKVRSLQFINYFKATEFRTILLYYGIVIFKDALDDETYIHFLQLCLATRLCSSKFYLKNVSVKNVACKLFEAFCINFKKIYGCDAVVSNIHNISHIYEDVNRFGSLCEISTYPFENHLRDIKLRIQPSKTPINQITRRLAEMFLDQPAKKINFDIIRHEKHYWAPEFKYGYKDSNESVYRFIQITPNVFLSTKRIADRWFITKYGDIVEMKHASFTNNSYFITGVPIKTKNDFFTLPFASSKSDIFVSNGEKGVEKMYHFKDIKAKMMCLSYEEDFVFIPMLHSLDECFDFFSK